jgi:hypothetical protein
MVATVSSQSHKESYLRGQAIRCGLPATTSRPGNQNYMTMTRASGTFIGQTQDESMIVSR